MFTSAELEKLCSAAFETKQDKNGNTVPLSENAQQFVDYVRLMAYCGTRRNETFGIKWADVDFDQGQLFIRQQVTERGIETLKNNEQRSVDFNPKLKALLTDMKERRAPDCEWLFHHHSGVTRTFQQRASASLWSWFVSGQNCQTSLSRPPPSFRQHGRHG